MKERKMVFHGEIKKTTSSWKIDNDGGTGHRVLQIVFLVSEDEAEQTESGLLAFRPNEPLRFEVTAQQLDIEHDGK